MKKMSWEKLKSKHLSKDKRREIKAAAVSEAIELSLRELRKRQSLSQQVVADSAGMMQSEICRVERSSDLKLSTLKRVVEALGGELEICAVIGRERVVLNIGS